jgi:polyribonucleotide 5'-hydroxyl-kinase
LQLTSLLASEDNSNFSSGDDADGMYGSQTEIYERIAPASFIQNSLLAVTTSAANEKQDIIRDSSVRGYLYVADVDETKKKVRLLSPQPGQTPSNAIVYGTFPEDVPGLLT